MGEVGTHMIKNNVEGVGLAKITMSQKWRNGNFMLKGKWWNFETNRTKEKL